MKQSESNNESFMHACTVHLITTISSTSLQGGAIILAKAVLNQCLNFCCGNPGMQKEILGKMVSLMSILCTVVFMNTAVQC